MLSNKLLQISKQYSGISGISRYATTAVKAEVQPGNLRSQWKSTAFNVEKMTELLDHDIDLIYLVAPTTTDERAAYILGKASGFVYYVSLKGTTGASNLDSDAVSKRLAELRAFTDLPICVGFGIKDARTAGTVAAFADGVVVGSSLVNLLATHVDDVAAGVAALEAEASALRQGIDARA